jgi:hypothetical protein
MLCAGSTELGLIDAQKVREKLSLGVYKLAMMRSTFTKNARREHSREEGAVT